MIHTSLALDCREAAYLHGLWHYEMVVPQGYVCGTRAKTRPILFGHIPCGTLSNTARGLNDENRRVNMETRIAHTCIYTHTDADLRATYFAHLSSSMCKCRNTYHAAL